MTESNQSCRKTTLIISLALALVACNGNESQQDSESVLDPGQQAAEQEQTRVVKTMNINEQVAFSLKDLATRLNVDPATVSLSGATPVTWRSGALGCPEPEMSYTQALVPGIWIMLRVGNTAYRYHAKPGGEPFFCPDERAEPPIIGAGAD